MAGMLCPNPKCKRTIDENTLREALVKKAKVVRCPHCGEEFPYTFEIPFGNRRKFSLASDSK